MIDKGFDYEKLNDQLVEIHLFHLFCLLSFSFKDTQHLHIRHYPIYRLYKIFTNHFKSA
jgi:hypothetical protein